MIQAATKPPQFIPQIATAKLGQNIMFVAITRPEGTWKAYAGIVAGKSLEIEANTVLLTGDVVPVGMARLIFGQFCHLPYAS